MELGLAGRRAVVTGGSKGIGKAIAGGLMAEGAAVTICSRHPGELDATAAELMKQAASEAAGTVLAMPCDVTVIPTLSSSRRRSTGLPVSASPRLFPWIWAVRGSR